MVIKGQYVAREELGSVQNTQVKGRLGRKAEAGAELKIHLVRAFVTSCAANG